MERGGGPLFYVFYPVIPVFYPVIPVFATMREAFFPCILR